MKDHGKLIRLLKEKGMVTFDAPEFQVYPMTDFIECDVCRAERGVLCFGCLSNRRVILQLQADARMKQDVVPFWSNTFLAQMTHTLAGIAIVLACDHLHKPWWAGAALTVAWAIPKEFVFDPIIEGASILDGAFDAAFYLVGALLATAFVYWL